MLCIGFLPVIYSWIHAKSQPSRLALPSDSEEEPATGAKAEIPQAPLDGWKVLLLWFPAACDLTGTTVRVPLLLNRRNLLMSRALMTLRLSCLFCHNARLQLMNVGLLYAPVSIYQMTRGALVLFVGVLSVIFLRRRLWLYQLSFARLPTYSAP